MTLTLDQYREHVGASVARALSRASESRSGGSQRVLEDAECQAVLEVYFLALVEAGGLDDPERQRRIVAAAVRRVGERTGLEVEVG